MDIYLELMADDSLHQFKCCICKYCLCEILL